MTGNNGLNQDKPDIKVLNIAQLFGGNEGTYKVPDYQREYSWKHDQIEALFEDFTEFHDEIRIGGNSHYLLGQAIFSTNPNNRSTYNLAIVDGQQRLTSLYLFTIVLHKWVSLLSTDQADEEVLAGLRQVLKYRNLATGTESSRIGVAVTGDEVISKLLNGEDLPLISNSNTQENIKNNYSLLNDLVQKKFRDDKSALIDFVDSFLHKIWIIQVTLSTDSLALSIFDKINSRGLPLNDAELLKVLVFRRALDSQFEAITSDWNTAASSVFKVKPMKAASMQYLMKSLLGQRIGVGTPNNKIAEAWESKLEESNEDMIGFARQIKDDAAYLARLGSKTSLVEHLHAARYFKTVQHFPIALATRKMSNSPHFEAFAKFLDTRVLLSLLAHEQPQTFERKIWPWAEKLSKLDQNSPLNEVLNAGLGSLDEVEVLMTNAHTYLSALDYRKPSDQRKMRFIIALCNKIAEFNADANSVDSDIENFIVKTHYDLDHIFPKSLVEDPNFDAENGKDWVHKIGNITLLHSQDNRRAGNANPGEKSRDYGSAKLILTKSLAKSNDLVTNDRVGRVISDLHGLGFQQVSSNWGYDQVMAQTDAYWAILSEHIRKNLALIS